MQDVDLRTPMQVGEEEHHMGPWLRAVGSPTLGRPLGRPWGRQSRPGQCTGWPPSCSILAAVGVVGVVGAIGHPPMSEDEKKKKKKKKKAVSEARARGSIPMSWYPAP